VDGAEGALWLIDQTLLSLVAIRIPEKSSMCWERLYRGLVTDTDTDTDTDTEAYQTALLLDSYAYRREGLLERLSLCIIQVAFPTNHTSSWGGHIIYLLLMVSLYVVLQART